MVLAENAPQQETGTAKKVVLSLGANIPPKKQNINKAITEIVKRKIGTLLLVSPFYRTPAWGRTEQEWFINNCILIDTELSPQDLLTALQKIETDMGRTREEVWGARPIDIDILLYQGVEQLDTPTLKIPHPLMTKRAFVLMPLADMLPWVGVHGRTVVDWLRDADKTGVQRLEPKDDLYEEILSYYWPNLNPRQVDPGLDRILAASEALGSPHQKLPPVIHVAGTNGKGSTLAFLRSVLKAAGKSAHCYTSPHLISYKERFIIGREGGESRFVAPDEFERTVMRIAPIIPQYQLSHFEALTLLAFLLFSEIPADYTLLETGMGGRLDATNIAENVIATAITSISLDHTEFLGDSIRQIAFEKAGIIKPEVPVILSSRDDTARNVIAQIAHKNKAPLYALGDAWDILEEEENDVYAYSADGGEFAFALNNLGLQGIHQSDNAGAALTLARVVLGQFPEKTQLEQGLAYVKWPARLELLKQEDVETPFPPDLEILLDGAHNAEGAELFGMTLADLQDTDARANIILMSIKSGKEPDPFFQALAEVSPKPFLYFIRDAGAFDQTDPEELVDYAETFGYAYEILEDWAHFTRVFRPQPDPKGIRLCVFGSLYLCGRFMNLMRYKVRA